MRRLTACRQDLRSYYSFQSSIIIFWPERLTTSFCRSRIPNSFIISAGITTDRLRCPTRVTLRIYFSITFSMTYPTHCYVACYVTRCNPKFVELPQWALLEAEPQGAQRNLEGAILLKNVLAYVQHVCIVQLYIKQKCLLNPT